MKVDIDRSTELLDVTSGGGAKTAPARNKGTDSGGAAGIFWNWDKMKIPAPPKSSLPLISLPSLCAFRRQLVRTTYKILFECASF